MSVKKLYWIVLKRRGIVWEVFETRGQKLLLMQPSDMNLIKMPQEITVNVFLRLYSLEYLDVFSCPED